MSGPAIWRLCEPVPRNLLHRLWEGLLPAEERLAWWGQQSARASQRLCSAEYLDLLGQLLGPVAGERHLTSTVHFIHARAHARHRACLNDVHSAGELLRRCSQAAMRQPTQQCGDSAPTEPEMIEWGLMMRILVPCMLTQRGEAPRVQSWHQRACLLPVQRCSMFRPCCTWRSTQSASSWPCGW